MDYGAFIEEDGDREARFIEEHPTVKQVRLPSVSESLKIDIGFHLLSGLIFGVGHCVGLWLIKKASE